MRLYRYISNEPNWPFVRSNELGSSDATKLPSSWAVDQFEIKAAHSVTPLKNGVQNWMLAKAGIIPDSGYLKVPASGFADSSFLRKPISVKLRDRPKWFQLVDSGGFSSPRPSPG